MTKATQNDDFVISTIEIREKLVKDPNNFFNLDYLIPFQSFDIGKPNKNLYKIISKLNALYEDKDTPITILYTIEKEIFPNEVMVGRYTHISQVEKDNNFDKTNLFWGLQELQDEGILKLEKVSVQPDNDKEITFEITLTYKKIVSPRRFYNIEDIESNFLFLPEDGTLQYQEEKIVLKKGSRDYALFFILWKNPNTPFDYRYITEHVNPLIEDNPFENMEQVRQRLQKVKAKLISKKNTYFPVQMGRSLEQKIIIFKLK